MLSTKTAQEIAAEYYPLVEPIARRLGKRYRLTPDQVDDLCGAGALALCEASERAAEKPPEVSLRAYLSGAIRYGMNAELDKDWLTSRQTRKYQQQKLAEAADKEETLPAFPVSARYEQLADDDQHAENTQTGDPYGLIELLHKAAADETDTQIIELRRQGNTFEQVAKELGATKSMVSKRLWKIERRLAGILETK